MFARSLRPIAAVFALALLFTLLPAGTRTAEAQGSRCFPETGQCIAGPIRTYWEQNGGLPIFGFPITEQRQESVEGRNLQVQWFERDRIEIQLDGTVTTGRLGVDRLVQLGTPFQQGNKISADPGCVAFRETGYQVCGQFRTFWERNGGLGRLGFPITGEFQTQIQGQTLTVQYFERRRFELHGNQVLLGLLGREVLDARNAGQGGGNQGGGGGQADPCANIPAPVSAAIEPNCGRVGTVYIAAGEGFQPGERIGFYITLPDQSVFGAPDQSVADRNGVSEVITIDTRGLPANLPIEGVWAITFEGTRSGHRAIAYFRVLR